MAKTLRDVKVALPDLQSGNRHGAGRPVITHRETSGVRAIVASWHARTLRVQPIGDLQRAVIGLEKHEANLYEHSPHAPRLLENLRAELARRENERPVVDYPIRKAA